MEVERIPQDSLSLGLRKHDVRQLFDSSFCVARLAEKVTVCVHLIEEDEEAIAQVNGSGSVDVYMPRGQNLPLVIERNKIESVPGKFAQAAFGQQGRIIIDAADEEVVQNWSAGQTT